MVSNVQTQPQAKSTQLAGLVLSLLLTLGGHRQAVAGNVRVHIHGHGVAVVDCTGEDAASQAITDLALTRRRSGRAPNAGS